MPPRRSSPYAETRPIDQQVIGQHLRLLVPLKRQIIRIEDSAYIVMDQVAFTGTIQFYVTRNPGKRYGGNLINDGKDPFKVFFESSAGYYSQPLTLAATQSIEFQNYPVSGITLSGGGTYTLVGWASKSAYGYVRRRTV